MRPIKLKMSAFLSYGKEQMIDFEKLGKSGLYLITGETGAGKTTIFDALTYALYGEPSGNLRDKDMLRNKSADPDEETFVELLFECNGQQYTVKRTPAYTRIKKRGSGFTTADASAELIYPNGQVVTKSAEVTKAVQEIIGLSKDQFAQIAMIAQGQFRELLVADTTSRMSIFRQIFKTENYQELQRRIKEDYTAQETVLNNLYSAVENEIDHIISENEEYDKSRIKDSDFLNAYIIEPLTKRVEEDCKRQEELKNSSENTSKQLSDASANVQKAEAYEKLVNRFNEETGKLQEAKNKEQDAKKAADEAKRFEEKIKELNSKVAVKKGNLSQYETLSEKVNEWKGLIRQKDSKAERREDLKKQFHADSEKLNQYKQEKDQLSDVRVELVSKNQESEKKKEAIKKNEDLMRSLKKLSKKNDSLKKAYDRCKSVKETAEKANNRLTDFNNKYLAEIAGVLAKNLISGTPCPVCGSLSHPKCAELSDEAITEDKLEQAKQENDKAQQLFHNESANFSKLKGEHETFRESIFDQLQNENLSDGIDNAEGLTQEKIESLSGNIENDCFNKRRELETICGEISELENKGRRYSELEKSIPELEKSIKTSKEAIDGLSNEISELEGNIGSLSVQIGEIQKHLEFPNIEAARADIARIENESNRYSLKIKETEEIHKKAKEDLDQLTGSISSLKRQISQSEKLSLTVQQEKMKFIEQSLKEINQQKTNVDTRVSTNTSVLDNIKKRSQTLETELKKYKWLKNLNETVSGKNVDNNGKIMLETYIQQAYFDRIVNKANKRFTKMSQGRYSLNRIKEALGNQSQSGLDLEVIDHYNSSKRSVKSLSGGEQFEASLSLALGLSDMVQESSAGVKLDCMFIDEGFGSLDEDTLRYAMAALKDLSDGNRLVGIISHVKDLEREIDTQIVVTKDGSGLSKAVINSCAAGSTSNQAKSKLKFNFGGNKS